MNETGFHVDDVPDAPPPKPRLVPVILVSIFTLPVFLICSGIATGIAIGIAIVMGKLSPDAMEDPIEAYLVAGLIPGMILLLYLPHLVIVGIAPAIAARISTGSIRERLGLTRSRLPLWTLLILVPATWFTSSIIYTVFPDVFADPGEAMKIIIRLVGGATPFAFVFIFAVIALQAGIVEEIFFRGYIQRRLLQRWSPVWAIAFSSAVFILFHFDLKHMLAIIPIAIWLGVIAWRADSIVPAMICHIGNNAFSVIMLRVTDEEQLLSADLTTNDIVRVVVTGFAFLIAVPLLVHYGRRARASVWSVVDAATSSPASPTDAEPSPPRDYGERPQGADERRDPSV